MLQLNSFAISGLLIVATSTVMALTMLVRTREKLQKIWGVFTVAVAVWGLGVYNIATTTNPDVAIWWWKIAYIGVIFIPVLLTHFVHVFLDIKKPLFLISVYAIGIAYLFLNFFTNLFINDVHFAFERFYYLSPTVLYNLFVIFFALLVIYNHVLLYLSYKTTAGERKLQLKYFFLGSFLGFWGGSFSFLPVYELNIFPHLNVLVAFYPAIMGYAIFRHKLFNVKVISTQIFVALLWVFLFVRTIIDQPWSAEQFFDILLLILTIITGIFLVRSVIQEIESREKIEKLALDLKQANDELRHLDQQKSEFVSIASHQLKSPLTAMKGYTSLLLDGSFGKLTKKIEEPVKRISQSSQQLINIIEDFLNIARIEQGRMEYNFAKIDALVLIKNITDELAPSIKEKGLRISIENDCGRKHEISADLGKIRQVFLNIIDNAVKYTPMGSILIKLSCDSSGKVVRLSVSDTGIGILPEMKNNLFKKFSRGKESARFHANGSGIGLYLGREIVRAHNGQIWAESSGKNKGSTFIVELPKAA